MKAALVLTCVALVLVLFGNWFSRESQHRFLDLEWSADHRPDAIDGWALAGTFAYLLAAAFGLVALLRMLS